MSSSSPARGRAPSSSSDPQTSPQRANEIPDDEDDLDEGEDLEENMMECVMLHFLLLSILFEHMHMFFYW